MVTATSVEDKEWKLVTSGTKRKVLLHLKAYNCKIGSPPSKLRRSWLCFQVKHLGQLTLNHQEEVASNSSGQPLSAMDRYPSADLACHLEKFTDCLEPGSGTLLQEFVQPCGYYTLLFFHVGTNDIVRGNVDGTKNDYRVLGHESWAESRAWGAQALFSNLLLRGKRM